MSQVAARSVLFSFPKQAKVGRSVAKSKIYEYGQVSAALRNKFVAQVEQITWQYKLAPETINLSARSGVEEIQIFDLALKTPELDEEILRAIDRAIPLPIIFQLRHEQRARMVATFKCASEVVADKKMIDGYFSGVWLAADVERQPLPVALDLYGLYEQLLRSVLPLSARLDENLPEQLQRLTQLRTLHGLQRKLEVRVHKEIQFNRKVELNAQLRLLNAQIDQLSV